MGRAGSSFVSADISNAAYATATLLEVFQPDLLGVPEREHSGYQYLEQVGPAALLHRV